MLNTEIFKSLEKMTNNERLEVIEIASQLIRKEIKSNTTGKKSFPQNGIIAQLTINPLKIPHFQPLTREEIHER